MPAILSIQSAFLRRLVMILITPIMLTFIVGLRVGKGLLNAFSDFRELFMSTWNGREVEAELLPCPFCGGKCIPTGWQTQGGAMGPACDDCGATCWSVDMWNNRIPITEEDMKIMQRWQEQYGDEDEDD